MIKEKRFNLRLSEVEYDAIEKKAQDLNWDISEYIRFCCLNARISITAGKTPEEELLSALQAIDSVEKIGGLDTTKEFLDSRRAEEVKKYVQKTQIIKNVQTKG